MTKTSSNQMPAKKAAASKAPAKKAAARSVAPATANKGVTARTTSLATYKKKKKSAAAPTKGFKAPEKKSAARNAPSGRFVSVPDERKPNPTTRAALAEVERMVAAFKKRHGIS